MVIKRRLLLGRKVITNLDSILKSRDITLPTKVNLVKTMVFSVAMYGCETSLVKYKNWWDLVPYFTTCKTIWIKIHEITHVVIIICFILKVLVRSPPSTIFNTTDFYVTELTHLNAEFQRISRRDKKYFLSDQCKEIEQNNRMGKTSDLFKKIRDTKGTLHAKWPQ